MWVFGLLLTASLALLALGLMQMQVSASRSDARRPCRQCRGSRGGRHRARGSDREQDDHCRRWVIHAARSSGDGADHRDRVDAGPLHGVGRATEPDAPEITAGKPISITMKPHYTGSSLDYAGFSFEGVKGSKSCGLCHPQNPEWEADTHRPSAVNPRFLTMYDGTDVTGRQGQMTKFGDAGKALPPDPTQPYYGPGFKLDYSNRAGNSAACHTPLASKISNIQNCGWSGCHTDLTTEKSRGAVPLGPSPMKLTGEAAEGVNCDFCHKIGDVYLD